MTPNTQTCRPDQLEALLNSDLSAAEEQQVLTHLDVCEKCRRRLDETAAAPDSWHDAQTFLQDDEHDRVSVTAVSDDCVRAAPQIAQVLDALDPTDDPDRLGRLGGYEVSGVIGAGGMGVVLKAFDRPLDRTVAIKVLAPHLATSGAARQRFAREARAAAAVVHLNVIAIHGVSTETSLPYLVMPYVGGASLQKRLDERGTLPVEDILRISTQIASGLAAAHDQGLVHRDIKPANILLDDGVDRLVITDFGLARAVDDASVTRTGVIAGTPQYMSPEQARGEFVDERSDLFSLGSVMYAMCTGRVPFRADSPYGVLRRISDSPARTIREFSPQVPEWLCRIVERLHAKSPAERYTNAHDVADLLTQCLAHVAQPTVHPPPRNLEDRRSARSLMPSRWLVPITACVIAVFAAIARLPSGATDDPANEPTTAEAQAEPQTPSTDDNAAGLQDEVQPSAPFVGNDQDAVVERSFPPGPLEPGSSDTPLEPQENPIPPRLSRRSNVSVQVPWETDDSRRTEWNDHLDGVLIHIEQSLQHLQAGE